MNAQLSLTQCQQARLTRDVRFDGRFFVAVKTTGIFCRPICPATTPKEKNIEYFSIAALALQAGYRRFNDAFQKILKLTPSDVRKRKLPQQQGNQVILAFRPPFLWQHLLAFYRLRTVAGMEQVGDDFYQRTFQQNKAQGWLRISPHTDTTLKLAFDIDDVTELRNVIATIRRMFDLDADTSVIESHLRNTDLAPLISPGIRIPGVWDPWEAGIRAILGQQVSVKAAIVQLNTLVAQLGKPLAQDEQQQLFPSPSAVAQADLSFLRMPQSRKDTVKRFAEFMLHESGQHPREWLALKGIGPWTVSYARLRGLSEPDCFLDTDLVVKKVIAPFENFNPGSTSPWGSYATFHCWSSQP